MSLRAMIEPSIYGIGEIDTYLLCVGFFSRMALVLDMKMYIHLCTGA